MPIDRKRLPSIEYWHQSLEFMAQHFYVSFCLFMSSIQDMFLGLHARKQKNLNWSGTYAYYSMVHGGRMLSFLAFGDFPRSHRYMRDLWYPRRGHRILQPYQYEFSLFDWLSDFAQGEVPNRRRGSMGPSSQECFDMAAGYFNSLITESLKPQLEQYGRILSYAADLRNDSNYEALLIAHEYNHIQVSESFENLSKNMCRAAEVSFVLFSKVFRGYLHHAPELESQRAEYLSFFFDYLNFRVGVAIQTKLAGDYELLERLRKLVFDLQPDSPRANYAHLEEWVSIDGFSRKGGLMGDFGNRVDSLVRAATLDI